MSYQLVLTKLKGLPAWIDKLKQMWNSDNVGHVSKTSGEPGSPADIFYTQEVGF